MIEVFGVFGAGFLTRKQQDATAISKAQPTLLARVAGIAFRPVRHQEYEAWREAPQPRRIEIARNGSGDDATRNLCRGVDQGVRGCLAALDRFRAPRQADGYL